jgi:predicted PurR-regulated permease PerM
MMRRFGRRLAGERGENSIILAGQAIRGVALGVGVTAIVQTVLGGIGLAVAGVPFASLLSAVMLMLCIAQIGPGLLTFSGGRLDVLDRRYRLGRVPCWCGV